MKYRYLTIKIDLEREVKKVKLGTEYKDKIWLIDIFHGKTLNHSGTLFSLEASGNPGKDLRKIFRKIRGELHLDK